MEEIGAQLTKRRVVCYSRKELNTVCSSLQGLKDLFPWSAGQSRGTCFQVRGGNALALRI